MRHACASRRAQWRRRAGAVQGVTLLHGVEVDVLADGSLDLDDATLASLDFVIASVHERLEMVGAR